MTRTIEISIKDRIAWQTNCEEYICGNSDFVVHFAFDDEWEALTTKTARFVYGEQFTDVVFSGDICNIPVIADAHKMKVGVYAGNLRTTTAAAVRCKKSILCGSGVPADPTPDVYAQLMEKLNKTKGASWNDLEDKPFYEQKTEMVVIDEQTFTTIGQTPEGFKIYEISNNNIDLYAGTEYIVKFDGVEYKCTGQQSGEGIIVGNPGKLHGELQGEDNGLPFCICNEYGEVVLIVGPGSNWSGEEITFTIYLAEVQTIVKKLDDKFSPERVRNVLIESRKPRDLSPSPYAASATFDEIEAWVQAGFEVYAFMRDVRLFLTRYEIDERVVFVSILDGFELVIVQIDYNDLVYVDSISLIPN